MKIKPYINKLNESKEYKTFQKKYKDAFLIAGFFVIDFESGRHVHQIDYYVPSQKKVAAFTLDQKVIMQMLNLMDKRVPEKLDMESHIDLDALKGIITEEMHNRNMTDSINKMIAILQTVDGRKLWNVNCVLSGMNLLKAHVEDDSQTVLKMERSSIFDYLQKVPGLKGAAGMQAAQPQPVSQIQPGAKMQAQPEASEVQAKQPDMKKALEQKIEQLDKLKEALRKEKVRLEDQESSSAKEKADLRALRAEKKASVAKDSKKRTTKK